MNEKINRLNKLKKLDINIGSIKKSIDVGEDYIEKLESIDNIDLLNNNINNSIAKIKSLSNISIILNSLWDDLKIQKNILSLAKKNIDENLKKYEDLLVQNEICPFCLSVIDENKIDHIIKHYN